MTITQKYTSAATSINSSRVPALFSRVVWEPDTINLDIGGGKYDTATEYLYGLGVTNCIYDPYNRTEAHNAQVMEYVDTYGADTVTVSNVLNVIMEKESRASTIQMAHDKLNERGTAYFTIYEGNKSGVGCVSNKGWQENRTTKDYVAEVKEIFAHVIVKNNVILAKKSLQRG